MDHVAKSPGPVGGWLKAGSRVNFLTNRLALIAPVTSKLKLTIAPDFPFAKVLGSDGRLAMGQIGAVPGGKYCKQALTCRPACKIDPV